MISREDNDDCDNDIVKLIHQHVMLRTSPSKSMKFAATPLAPTPFRPKVRQKA